MTKKTQETNELQTLGTSPTGTLEEEVTPFLAQDTKHNEKREASTEMYQGAPNSISRIPSFKLSTPGYSKVSYLNEKESKKDGNPEVVELRKEHPSSIFGRQHKSYAKGPPRPPLPTRETQREFLAFKNNGISSSVSSRKPMYVNTSRQLLDPSHERIHYSRSMERPTQHHTFIADPADVRQIEDGLLQLMEEFHTGNLRAFGKDSRLRQMEEIREQQEKLARLHFEVGAEQEQYLPLSEEGLRVSDLNMKKVMEKLAQLSESIENLHTNCHEKRNIHGGTLSSSHSDIDGIHKLNYNKGCPSSPQYESGLSSSNSDHLNTLTKTNTQSLFPMPKEVPLSVPPKTHKPLNS